MKSSYDFQRELYDTCRQSSSGICAVNWLKCAMSKHVVHVKEFMWILCELLCVIWPRLFLCQVKVQGQNREMLQAACQQFLGKREEDIRRIALETLEGHQRAIMGNMTVEVKLVSFWCRYLPWDLPSVLWHCWLGIRRGIRPIKNWVVRCRQSADDLHIVYLMPLSPRHLLLH